MLRVGFTFGGFFLKNSVALPLGDLNFELLNNLTSQLMEKMVMTICFYQHFACERKTEKEKILKKSEI